MRRSHAFAVAFAVAFVLVVVAAPALAQAPTAADAPAPAAADLPVLFGMHWGDPVQAGMEQEQVERVGPNTTFYRRSSDKLTLESAPLEVVHYIFEDGKLAGFSIKFAAAEKDAVIAAATKLWGKPAVQSGTYFWLTPALMGKLRELGKTQSYTLNLYPPPAAPSHPAK